MKKMRCFLCAFIVVFNIIFTDQEVQAHDPTLGRKWQEEPGYTAKLFLKKTEGYRWTSVKGSLQSLHRLWTKSQLLDDVLLHTGLATGERNGASVWEGLACICYLKPELGPQWIPSMMGQLSSVAHLLIMYNIIFGYDIWAIEIIIIIAHIAKLA